MSAREQARRWFLEAQADLEVVQALRKDGYHNAACFHAQQAVEKALKAVFIAVEGQYPLTHSCKELLRRASRYALSLIHI